MVAGDDKRFNIYKCVCTVWSVYPCFHVETKYIYEYVRLAVLEDCGSCRLLMANG